MASAFTPLSPPTTMPTYQKFFHRILQKHFPQKSTSLQAQIDLEFAALQQDIRFGATSSNPMDRRMDIAGYFLATIKALDKEGIAYETIRSIVLEIAQEYVKPRSRFHLFLKQLPPKLISTRFGKMLINYFKTRFYENTHAEGFKVKIITDKTDTFGFGYGFDIVECGICKLFKKHDYQKFASVLCEVDYITSGLAGLTLIRTGTIATGAKICDFRFQKNTDYS